MRHFTIPLLASSMLISVIVQADRSDWPSNFTIGTSSQGGTYYVYGSGWANLLSNELGVSRRGENDCRYSASGRQARAPNEAALDEIDFLNECVHL